MAREWLQIGADTELVTWSPRPSSHVAHTCSTSATRHIRSLASNPPDNLTVLGHAAHVYDLPAFSAALSSELVDRHATDSRRVTQVASTKGRNIVSTPLDICVYIV